MKTPLKKVLEKKIPKEKIGFVNRAFEVVGDIAICGISKEVKKYEKIIGDSILKSNSSIKVVLKKSGIHTGKFRCQKLIFLCGERRKETTYIENKIKLKLDVEKVYFSSKLSGERFFLSSKVKENSSILVMFSGCAPYTFNIAKQNPNIKKISSVEINPVGHSYAKKNLELNKNILKKSKKFKEILEKLICEKIYIDKKKIIEKLNKKVFEFFNLDVKKFVLENPKKKYDEIFMPLPKSATNFLDCAFLVAKKNCVVHIYDFVLEEEFPQKTKSLVESLAKKNKKKIEIIDIRKVGNYAPKKFRVCCDFIVLS